MKKKILSLCALCLACLLVITACGKSGQQGNKPDDSQQQGSSGTGSGTSGADQPGGSTGSGTSGTGDVKQTKLGEVDGVSYWLLDFNRSQSSNDATTYQLCAVSGTQLATTVLYSTDGTLEYAAGSLEKSGNTALYFTAGKQGENATLYCYDLYSKEVMQVLAAPCSNMVVFAGSGKLDGYGWILQDDYVMAVDLKTQTADMTMAGSTMEIGGFADVGGSFFGNQKSASIQESEYGVLEITVSTGSTLTGYLYTCETFTAVKMK